MPNDFLVELGTEELPPKFLLTLAKEFSQNIEESLKAEKLAFSELRFFATPRRLAVLVSSLADQAPDEDLEIFGPPAKIAFDKNGKPTKAAEAFAKKNGIDVSALLTDEASGKLVHRASAKGAVAINVIPGIVENALNKLPIAKRMRWGASRAEFVRPVKWLVLLSGSTVIDAEIYGVKSGNTTRGHRFHANHDIQIDTPANYEKQLLDASIVADFSARQTQIKTQVENVAKELGGVAVIGEDLLEEVTGLVELPVALAGKFDEEFLSVPAEALISSMKEHQKYFHVVNDKGDLLPNFITLANLQSNDPSQVIAGNEKVIRPRLADAAFFFEQDKHLSLEARREKLKTVVFQAKLGSIYDKTERIRELSHFIAEKIGADTVLVKRTAELCKSDLVSSMVNEFSDMQGIAGYHYALNDNEDINVAIAVNEYYKPKFAGDTLPSSDIGAIVALADRLDTITGIFGIGQTPTGSKDPFALRRASLGALRILVEKQYALDLRDLIGKAATLFTALPKADSVVDDVLAYMLDRFKSWYEEANIPAVVFQSVSAKKLSSPLDINNRVYAVAAFSQLPEAAALASANKRVANILAKQGKDIETAPVSNLFIEPAEKELAAQLDAMAKKVQPLFEENNFTEALSTLADLRKSVDTFFDDVMVMTEDEKVRNNRLALLQQLRSLFLEVADISLLDVKA